MVHPTMIPVSQHSLGQQLSRSRCMHITPAANGAPLPSLHIGCARNTAAAARKSASIGTHLPPYAHSRSASSSGAASSCSGSGSHAAGSRTASVARAAGGGRMPQQQDMLTQMMMAYAMQMQQQQEAAAGNMNAPFGAEIRVEGLLFHPPGAEKPLLQDVSFTLPPNRLGLVIGRSGSGKTTLLQMLSGLLEQDKGGISIVPPASAGRLAAGVPVTPSTVEGRMQQVGLVFQFPERHFLGTDILQELTFTWPREAAYLAERNALSARVQGVMEAVGLAHVPLNVSPLALSGGQQRRLALAIQLIRRPALLLLDEPLAGLDWQSRREVVDLLRQLKERCTVLVVSHDLAEIAPLVDCAWRMRLGGTCERVDWPPPDLEHLEQ